MQPNVYLELWVDVSKDQEDLWSSFCFEEGAAGIETVKESTTRATLRIFFEDAIPEKARQLPEQFRLTYALEGKPPTLIKLEMPPYQDWNLAWKEYFLPLPVGQSFVVCPPWLQHEVPNNKTALVIEPGQGFGTGYHPSTVLALETLEYCVLQSELSVSSLLDVGIGSGILSLAAGHLGVKHLHGIDIDLPSVVEVQRNWELNNLSAPIQVIAGSANCLNRQYDLVVSNMLLHELLSVKEDLARLVHSSGRVICSGFLEQQWSELEQAFRALDLFPEQLFCKEQWRAVIFCKTPQSSQKRMPPGRKNPPSGIALLLTMIFMVGMSAWILYWYRNEIQFRLQADAALRYQSIYQELDGVLAHSLSHLQQYPESQLRETSLRLGNTELSFFPGWSVQTLPEGASSTLPLAINYQAEAGPLQFEALLHLQRFSLTTVPWFHAGASSNPWPNQLTFAQETDHQTALNAPKFPLPKDPVVSTFDASFPNGAELQREEAQLFVISEGTIPIELKPTNSMLRIQIRGDATWVGNLTTHFEIPIYLEILGNLTLVLAGTTPGFREATPFLFVYTTGDIILQHTTGDGGFLAINGYFRVEGSRCLSLASGLQGVYWQGSLACETDLPIQFSVPIHLQHVAPTISAPEALERTALRNNGVQVKSL